MKKALLGLAVALTAAVSWLVLTSPGHFSPADTTPPSLAPATETPSGTATAESSSVPHGPAPMDARASAEVERSRAPARVPSDTAQEPTTTIRGRCVDAETIAPLDGCQVALIGRATDPRRRKDYERRHGPVVWADPEAVTTEGDGLFAFTFVPPPPHSFELRISREGRVGLEANWHSLDTGEQIDLGDVPMESGAVVTGTVADSRGMPQAKQQVRLRHLETPHGVRPTWIHDTRTTDDGSFQFADRFAAGTWSIEAEGRQIASDKHIEISAGTEHEHLEITTVSLDELEIITGIVVDEAGEPVQHAWISGRELKYNSSASTRTDAQGRFRLERPAANEVSAELRRARTAGLVDSVEMLVLLDGYEPLLPRDRVPWGTRDLHLTLDRAEILEIRVVDGPTGDPVEEFGLHLRLAPVGNKWGAFTVPDIELRNPQPHPGGVVSLPMRTGHHMLIVKPTSEQWATSDFVYFAVERGPPAPVIVELDRAATRTLRVERTDGSPVRGTEVELLQPPRHAEVRTSTMAVPVESVDSYESSAAGLLLRGATDDAGELDLRGPSQREITMRLLGPGHQPTIRQVTLGDEPDPWIVVVSSGATLAGTVGPPEVVRQMFPLLGRHQPDPRLVLWRTVDRPPTATIGEITTDGSFEITGIEEGTWEVWLDYDLHGESASVDGQELVTTLANLRNGDTRTLEIDIGHLAPATLRGVVRVNGAPREGLRVWLSRPLRYIDQDRTQVSSFATCDRDGRFEVLAVPGEYRLGALLPVEGDQQAGAAISGSQVVHLTPGGRFAQEFDLAAGGLTLRLRQHGGQPAAGVMVQLTPRGEGQPWMLPMTDKDGRTSLDVCPPGVFEALGFPAHFMESDAVEQLMARHRDDPEAMRRAFEELTRLGDLEVRVAEETTLEFTLKEWPR